MTEIIKYFLVLTAQMGYTGIVLMMAVESSFIPLPSEIVIPPAAYLASQGQMNIFLVIIAGTIGSMIGATFNYFLALWLGRKIIYALADHRYARIFLIRSKHLAEAEKYFLEYGNISTFLGRLLPGIRHLISIPAGFSRMPYRDFIRYTFLGSFIWVTILAIIGYVFGANEALLRAYYKMMIVGVIVFSFIVLLSYLWWQRRKKNHSTIDSPGDFR